MKEHLLALKRKYRLQQKAIKYSHKLVEVIEQGDLVIMTKDRYNKFVEVWQNKPTMAIINNRTCIEYKGIKWYMEG